MACHQPAGELTLYALGVGLALPGPEVIRPDQPRASALLQDLASGQYPGDATSATATAFHDLLFRLVTETCRTLLQTRALSGDVDNVLSLVGRALFARFLIDRGLLNARTGPDLVSRSSSASPAPSRPNSFASGWIGPSMAIFCRWLTNATAISSRGWVATLTPYSAA